MATLETWTPIEAGIKEILARFPQPLMALAQGETPAFILRRAFDPAHCAGLIERFYERGLVYDPHKNSEGNPHRVDIGTSFGHHRADREEFFAHSAQTHRLFGELFEGYDDPVRTMYAALQALVPDKEVKTARESDGRLYGPAIFRIYHEALGHGPHYDSVAKRSRAFDYAVSRFKHQFAGVLCFQNSTVVGGSGEPFLYNCPWTPDFDAERQDVPIKEFLEQRQVERVQVQLEPGDLYFFFTENFHEVPAVVGAQPRAVLAIFFAMSPDDNEVFVWA